MTKQPIRAYRPHDNSIWWLDEDSVWHREIPPYIETDLDRARKRVMCRRLRRRLAKEPTPQGGAQQLPVVLYPDVRRAMLIGAAAYILLLVLIFVALVAL